MPISCGHTSPLGHPFRQWPGLSSSLYLIHQVARRHASRQKQQLLIALNAFISLSQHTRSDYLYIFLIGTKRSWEKLRFTLHQHKLSSPSLQNLARFKRNWEPALSWQLQEGDRDVIEKGHLSQMLASFCTSLPGYVYTRNSSIKTLSVHFNWNCSLPLKLNSLIQVAAAPPSKQKVSVRGRGRANHPCSANSFIK